MHFPLPSSLRTFGTMQLGLPSDVMDWLIQDSSTFPCDPSWFERIEAGQFTFGDVALPAGIIVDWERHYGHITMLVIGEYDALRQVLERAAQGFMSQTKPLIGRSAKHGLAGEAKLCGLRNMAFFTTSPDVASLGTRMLASMVEFRVVQWYETPDGMKIPRSWVDVMYPVWSNTPPTPEQNIVTAANLLRHARYRVDSELAEFNVSTSSEDFKAVSKQSVLAIIDDALLPLSGYGANKADSDEKGEVGEWALVAPKSSGGQVVDADAWEWEGEWVKKVDITFPTTRRMEAIGFVLGLRAHGINITLINHDIRVTFNREQMGLDPGPLQVMAYAVSEAECVVLDRLVESAVAFACKMREVSRPASTTKS